MFKNIYRTSWFSTSSVSTPVTLSNSHIRFTHCLGKVESLLNSKQKFLCCEIQQSLHKYQRLTIATSSIFKKMCASGAAAKHSNRLIGEKSPYLLQHAHNPVDWYPWGDEAIRKAKQDNKLIFLSVGYSTCHWCHVMERESFEDEDVARIMNQHFINIKVDREERPDIDKIYMQFVLMMNGHGGWPMSVWLTPDLTPLTAGTYFPPHSRYGIPSFSTVLRTVSAQWKTKEAELKETGAMVINAIQNTLSEKVTEATFEPGSVEIKLREALNIFKQRYDHIYGGFGKHPKFPEVSRLNFLLHTYAVTKERDILAMPLNSLSQIGSGGIHDHIFGGFSRYAVDHKWHVPHFEKMLYDQGQLMASYASAYQLTSDPAYLNFADGIFQYIMTDLRHSSGGFFSGEDADSLPTVNDEVKVEGAFYAWTSSEIQDAILKCNSEYFENIDPKKVFELYSHHYDVRPTGNVDPANDPHGHFKEKNILIVRESVEDTCEKFELEPAVLERVLAAVNKILHEIRNKRPRPHLDTKIITAWNGLVLSGLSKLANCKGNKQLEYLQAAKDLVQFARINLFDKDKKFLRRSCYGSTTDKTKLEEILTDPIKGFLDDYAFFIKGLLDYYKSSLDGTALMWAKELQDIQDRLFWDDQHGGYFYSMENSPNVIVRLKEDHDGAEPCANSVSAHNLLLLSYYFDDTAYSTTASKLFGFFADVNPFGYTLPEMMSALLIQENGMDLTAVVGPETEMTKQCLQICREFFIPGMIIIHVDPKNDTGAGNDRAQNKYKMVDGKPTVYICENKVCEIPITDPEQLNEILKKKFLSKREM